MMIVLVNKNKEVVNFKTGEVFRILGKTIDTSKENLLDKYYYNELTKAMNTEKEVFMKNIDTSMEIDYDKYDIYTFTTSVQYCITNDIKGIQSGEFRGFKVLTRTMNAAHGNNMKYEIGKLYEEDIIPRVGTCGFHFSDTFVGASIQYILERNIRMFTVKIPKGSILSVRSKFDAIDGMVYSSNKIILESEVNVEDYLMNIDIKSEMSNDIFRNCSLNNFNLSIDFYKYIVNSDLPDDYLKSVLFIKFDRVNEADEWNSEWEDILDETIERFDRNGNSVLINDFLTYYSSEKRIEILKEKNIYDLSCIKVGDFPILGLQYFLDNADKFRLQRLSMYTSLKLVNALYKMIDSSDIINNIDNEIIKYYLLNINLDMFRELINNHFTWVMNNLDKFNLFKLVSMSEKDYNELLLKIDDPNLHHKRLDGYGVCSLELFVKLIEKSKIKFKEYKYINFTTLEQIEYIIKKCGNRYDMILEILYINRHRFGINSIYVYGQDSLKYKYLIKKYSKLNKRQNKRKHFNFRRIVGHIPEDFDGDFKINDMPVDDERLVKVPRICSQERHSVFGTECFRRIF